MKYVRPEPVAPVRTPESPPFDGWQESHPSYGMIGFYRTPGHTRLFGSRLPSHNNYITLRIQTATRRFSHGEERVSGAGGRQIVEVAMSSVQFARLLTEMNMGDGVPCTLRYVDGVKRPEVSETPPELHEATEEARARVAAIREKTAADIASVRELMTGKVPKKVQEAVESILQSHLNHVTSSVPFWSQRVEEAASRASAEAKAEVDAYVTSAVHKAGLAAMSDPEIMRRLLTDDAAKGGGAA